MRRWPAAVAGALLACALAGCSAGDSTVSKTPMPASPTTSQPSTPTSSDTPAPTSSPPSTPTGSPTAQAAPPQSCAVDLTAPEIARAVAQLPRDPRSRQGWNPEPVAGNYNECAALSAVIVEANTNAENPNTRAVLFHRGKYIASGVPDTFGFTGIDATASTGETLALTFSSGPGLAGLQSVVRFRWNGSGVELIGNTQ